MEYCTGNILKTSRLLVPEDLTEEGCCWLHLLIGQFLNSFKVKSIILLSSYDNLGWKEFLEVIQVCFLLWARVTLMARLLWPLSIQMVKPPKDGDSTMSLPTLGGIRFCVKFFHYLNYLKLLFSCFRLNQLFERQADAWHFSAFIVVFLQYECSSKWQLNTPAWQTTCITYSFEEELSHSRVMDCIRNTDGKLPQRDIVSLSTCA